MNLGIKVYTDEFTGSYRIHLRSSPHRVEEPYRLLRDLEQFGLYFDDVSGE